MNSNYEQALKWYAKAADMGNAEAQYKLGKILAEAGKLEEGERYLRLSSQQGNNEADELLEKLFGECLVFESPEQFSIWTSKRWDGIIEYSLDRLKWQEWDGKIIRSEKNVIYMRGYDNTLITGEYGSSWNFHTTTELICRGNIEVLLDYRLVRKGKHPKMKANCYRSMFYNCKSLEEAPQLPAMHLADSCYMSMFADCRSLKKAPALPATKLASNCYRGMFWNCMLLKELPKLPAMHLADRCYMGMFRNCRSLKKAPALPATNLARECYSEMFYGCKSMEDVPELPATEFAYNCYDSMFAFCKSLKNVPQWLVYDWYYQMFKCRSRDKAGELKSILAIIRFRSIFSDCISFEEVMELMAATKLTISGFESMFYQGLGY